MNVLQQSLWFVAILASFLLFGWLVYYLQPVLTPFLIAMVLAYFADPLVGKLTFTKWKISRTIASVIVFALVVLLVAIILVILLPALGRQLVAMIERLPDSIEWLQSVLVPQLAAWGVMPETIDIESLKKMISQHLSQITDVTKWMGTTLFSSGMAFVNGMINLLIVFVATFYLLRDWPKVKSGIQSLVPASIAPRFFKITKQCNKVLSTFLRGQLTVMLALGLIYGVGLSLIGVNFSALLGATAGLLSIVPYLGTIVGVTASVFVAYVQFHHWTPVIEVLVLFGVGNLIEGMILTPLLIGDKLGLHPVAVIFAVLAGGRLLGFTGVLIALPVAAILVVIFREFRGEKQYA